MVIMSKFMTVRERGPSLAVVTITGTGRDYFSAVTIHGTEYKSATSGIEALTGDIITFTVCGVGSGTAEGKLVIDGTQVLSVKDGNEISYRWEIPAGVTRVDIALTYHNIGAGTVTVTTS